MKTGSRFIIAAMLCWSWSACLDAAERPNTLLIVSEDNGPELGCYGSLPYRLSRPRSVC